MTRPLPELELWFDFGSNYSYLSVMRIREAAARRGGHYLSARRHK